MKSIKLPLDQEMSRFKIEANEKWRELITNIPYLQFPEGYEVKIIPPFGGAIARFMIKKIDSDKTISVYLDAFSRLGCMNNVYWEMYPYKDDVNRFILGEEKELIEAIIEELANA